MNIHELLAMNPVLRIVRRWTGTGNYEGEQKEDTFVWQDPATVKYIPFESVVLDADIMCSDIQGSDKHLLMFDIDLPCYARESSPGKYHIVIGKEVTWKQYVTLLDAFVEAGIVEAGYAESSKRRGFGALRLPWCKKERVTATDNAREY